MEEESIFDYLARRRKVNALRVVKGLKGDEQYLKDLASVDREPVNDIAERILKEFEERNGELTGAERAEGLRYFADDFAKSQTDAEEYFEESLKKKPGRKGYNERLEKALDLTMRAVRDVKFAQKINPGTDINLHKKVLYALQSFRDEIYFALEFPSCHEKISYLNLKKKNAAKNGDYKYAAKLRDDMRKILAKLPTHGFNDRMLY